MAEYSSETYDNLLKVAGTPNLPSSALDTPSLHPPSSRHPAFSGLM